VVPTCPRFFFPLKKKNHKKSRQNREGHDDECGKRVGVINKENQETHPPKEKGEKSSQFLSGYILQAPWNLGPISISFMYNLSLFGNSLTHSLTAQFPLLLFVTFSPISSYNNNNTRIHGDTITAMAITPTPTTTTTLTHSYKKVCKKLSLSLSLSVCSSLLTPIVFVFLLGCEVG
jgi:hypothetical protein